MSMEARNLIARMPDSVEVTWSLILAVEDVLLDCKVMTWLSVNDTTEKAIAFLQNTKARGSIRRRPDSPGLAYQPAHLDNYRTICERYMQADFSRKDALLLASICVRYPHAKVTRAIQEVGSKSRSLVFLDAALKSMPDADLEAERRDVAITELLNNSPRLVPPAVRVPGLLRSVAEEGRVNAAIDRLHKESR